MGKPPIMASAPQFMGLIGLPISILMPVRPTPHTKHAQMAVVVIPRQYSPSINGARNAPANAPHEIPMSCAINVGGLRAIIKEMTMKKTMRMRMITTFRRSTFSETVSLMLPSSTSPGSDFLSRYIMSRVRVLADVSTSDASVDIDAERTSSVTRAMRMSGNVMSIEGTMASKSRRPLGRSGGVPNSRPKPPRK